MSNYETKKMIKRHEGFSNEIYIDTMGIPTVGYGHALHTGSTIPTYICDILFEQDYKNTLNDYDKLNLKLDPIRKGIIINMLFNLGLSRFCKFKRMISALRNHDYNLAAIEMKDSKWFTQVGLRAKELHNLMISGEYS